LGDVGETHQELFYPPVMMFDTPLNRIPLPPQVEGINVFSRGVRGAYEALKIDRLTTARME
jgi:hypothetical protein